MFTSPKLLPSLTISVLPKYLYFLSSSSSTGPSFFVQHENISIIAMLSLLSSNTDILSLSSFFEVIFLNFLFFALSSYFNHTLLITSYKYEFSITISLFFFRFIYNSYFSCWDLGAIHSKSASASTFFLFTKISTTSSSNIFLYLCPIFSINSLSKVSISSSSSNNLFPNDSCLKFLRIIVEPSSYLCICLKLSFERFTSNFEYS